MCGEREVVNRQATDQRLDISVVLTVLATGLRDGCDVSNESIGIVAYTVGFAVEKPQPSSVGDVGEIRWDGSCGPVRSVWR